MSRTSFLQNTFLADLVFNKKELIQVDSKETLENVLRILQKNNILSAPVFDSEKRQYIGMIDTFDVMTAFAFGIFLPTKTDQGYRRQKFDPAQFKSFTAADLLREIDRPKRIDVFEPTDNVGSVIDIMGTERVHRILVSGQDDHTRARCYRLLSQFDLIKYFFDNAEKFGLHFSRTAQEYGLGSDFAPKLGLYTANEYEITIDIFQKMWDYKITAVPVVDGSGKIIATLSVSDLRGITSDRINDLELPVISFLQTVHKGKSPHPVTCTPNSTLKEIMLQAIGAHVHRVWVVNSAQEPVGVVSFSDIIATFALTRK